MSWELHGKFPYVASLLDSVLLVCFGKLVDPYCLLIRWLVVEWITAVIVYRILRLAGVASSMLCCSFFAASFVHRCQGLKTPQGYLAGGTLLLLLLLLLLCCFNVLKCFDVLMFCGCATEGCTTLHPQMHRFCSSLFWMPKALKQLDKLKTHWY